MTFLDSIRSPDDVKQLSRKDLQALAAEVRQRLIDVVSLTGGHIGAGLGVVELTVALAYSFHSPIDKIVWDVGHQGYPWKILTGRNDRLPTLRQETGLSGFLRRTESEHDIMGAGHAGTAMSAALGIAAARDMKGEDYNVVAVVGDGALTCGLSYEGMNNAGHSDRDIIMVLNDNGMSIAPNVGAMSRYLGAVIASPFTNRMREHVKHMIERASHLVGGQRVVEFAKTVEDSATSGPSTATTSKRWCARSSWSRRSRALESCTSSPRRARVFRSRPLTSRSSTQETHTIQSPASCARPR
jgi:1-deoxy-D-xylulose-5-phosphate synthase